MRFKCLLFILVLVFVPVALWAATITAKSCSLADVTAAYNAAYPGDTVYVPAGSATWSSQLAITKAITLQGAGLDSTIINHNYAGSLIYINPGSDLAIRITGLHIKQTTNNPGYVAIYINGSKNGSFCLTQIRIDQNKLEKGTRTVYATGWVESCIDNNTFLNCNIAVGVAGDNDYAWGRTIEAGTSQALFIEDNTFTVDNDADRQPNEQIYHQEGGRTVVRYNTYDASAYTDYASGLASFYDSHGNWGPSSDINAYRGQPILEMYNNTIHIYKAIGSDISHLRGGSALIYNNTYIYDKGGEPYTIRCTDEESWQTIIFNPLDTVWPAEDQVTNTFIWNNTLQVGAEGTPTPITDVKLNFPADSTFIVKDRDYFMHAPAATGGKSIYPTRAGASDMIFSSSGPNAYYPYTPYIYPHPLSKSSAPENLRVVPTE
jgi:hypothetical protein